MDFYSDSEHPEKVDGEKYREQSRTEEPQAEWETDQNVRDIRETRESRVSRSRMPNNPWVSIFLSLFAVLASFLYYFYGNYTNHTLLVRSHLIPSMLVILSVLLMINPMSNYYLKSILLLIIAADGIYVSSNQFAIEWVLMGSAGLVMFFRVTKTQRNDKSAKKESRGRRNQRQSA